jgi:phospholipid-binding lipoprotein MlaA
MLALAACSHAPQGQSDPDQLAANDDPLEPMNRAIFQFNQAVDTMALKPVTQLYREVTPEKGRELVSNFIDNLGMPVNMANSVLQLDAQNTFKSFWSFFVNTAFGMGGLFDVASEIPLKPRETDFGQTLAIYGADSGSYLVLPILGPSNVRDGIGRVADMAMDPFNYVDDGVNMVKAGVTAVDARSRNMTLIDDVFRTSLDPYTTFKSGYEQRRASEIKRAKQARKESLEKVDN